METISILLSSNTIKANILCHLTVKDIISISRTNKLFHSLVDIGSISNSIKVGCLNCDLRPSFWYHMLPIPLVKQKAAIKFYGKSMTITYEYIKELSRQLNTRFKEDIRKYFYYLEIPRALSKLDLLVPSMAKKYLSVYWSAWYI